MTSNKDKYKNTIFDRILVTDLNFSQKALALLKEKNISSLSDLTKFIENELIKSSSITEEDYDRWYEEEQKKLPKAPHNHKTSNSTKSNFSLHPADETFNINTLRSLADLNLSIRARNCLKKNNIKFLGELAQIPEHKIIKFKNFGKTTLQELTGKLSLYGLRFGMKINYWNDKDHLIKKYKDELISLRRKETISSIEEFLGHKISTIEDEIKGIIHTLEIKNKNEEEVFILRNGLNGEGTKTLQEIGDLKGKTRERIRQLEAKVLEKLEHANLITDIIDRTLIKVSEQNFITTKEEIGRSLCDSGIAKNNVDLKVLLKLAKFLKREIKFQIVTYKGIQLVVPDKCRDFKRPIINARKYSSKYGFSCIEDIQDSFVPGERQYSKDEILYLLKLNSDFTWLDEESGYFYFKNSRNRLINSLRKIFSVTKSLDVEILKSALRRDVRVTRTPPKQMLLKFCSELESFVVEGNIIKYTALTNSSDELGEIEHKLFRIFTLHGPLLNRHELENHAKIEGINENSLSIYLGYSMIVRRYDTGVYGLIGINVSLSEIEAKKLPSNRKNKVYQDSGWTIDAKIWIMHKISESMLNSGVCYIPPVTKNSINDGIYQVCSSELEILDSIRVKDNNCWNFKKSFKKLGADSGDYLLTKWDMNENKVYFYVGDESLIDESDNPVALPDLKELK